MRTDTPARRAIDRYDTFVRHVTGLCEDVPERRASLRRGLGRPPEQAFGMHATVARWLPDREDRAEECALYSVAAMIAAQVRSGQHSERATDTDPGDTERAAIDEDAPQVSGAGGDPDPDSGGRRRRPSLGTALAAAVNATATARRPIGQATAEKRLHLLVRQDLTGVHRQLPGLVRHIRSLDAPVDWAQLIDDLRWWERGRDLVAKRWLQDFYRTLNPDTQE